MSGNKSKPIDRYAEILLALTQGVADHRLSDGERQSRRDEVNRLLSQIDDGVIVDALNRLYRTAESDARHRAHRLTHALAEDGNQTWFAHLRQKLLFSRRRRA